jgi:hypothetical protein
MNITQKWKRFMAVGCSHGNLIDPKAADAVLRFRDQWKPATVAHLGDFVDTAAFRSGAAGSSDESEPIGPDIDAGLAFLGALRPTLVFNGNHEARLWRLQNHHNAIVSDCAGQIINRLRMTTTRLKAEYVEDWGIRAWRRLGNYSLGHGYLFGESFLRDTAESHGNTIIAHAHRAGMATGRRSDAATAYCVGTLSDIPNMDYASARRSTLSWAAGFVWGEYTDTQTVCWLHIQPQGQTEWRLPA